MRSFAALLVDAVVVVVVVVVVDDGVHTSNHRLRGSASPVLTATGFVNGKGQFSTPHTIDTPQPITKQFVTGKYVGNPNSCAKLGAHPSTGEFWAYG